jgi:hypothetical protein
MSFTEKPLKAGLSASTVVSFVRSCSADPRTTTDSSIHGPAEDESGDAWVPERTAAEKDAPVLLAVIVGCEIAFWVVLVLGLAVRYLGRRPRLGAAILVGVPLVDLVLLVVTVLHLRMGGTPDATTGLAAAYIGVSVAFGPSIIARMDARFAHRYGGGPPVQKPPRYGAERAQYEWSELRKAALTFVIASLLLLGGVALVGGFDRGQPLLSWIYKLALVLLIWLAVAVSYRLWPAEPKETAQG